MKAIDKVMACVDLSDYSKETMEYAFALGRGLMADILLFNVINIRDVWAVENVSHFYPHTINVDDYVEKMKAQRKNQINELVKSHFPTETEGIEIIVRLGIPYQEILRGIETEKADLVVIGNKGRGNVMGTLFGSNVEKVFRHSPAPIVSIRNHTKFSRVK